MKMFLYNLLAISVFTVPLSVLARYDFTAKPIQIRVLSADNKPVPHLTFIFDTKAQDRKLGFVFGVPVFAQITVDVDKLFKTTDSDGVVT